MPVPSHKHIKYETAIVELQRQVKKLERQISKANNATLHVYSADNDACIGMHAVNWHRIVCNYEGHVCLGTPRKHWTSVWSFNERGFSIERMYDETYKGWEGHFSEDSIIKFHELPKDVVALHVKIVQDFIKSKCETWLPGCIFNDLTGELYSP